MEQARCQQEERDWNIKNKKNDALNEVLYLLIEGDTHACMGGHKPTQVPTPLVKCILRI